MDSIFQQLWYAYVSRQGGTVHVRQIMAPLFNEESAVAETIAFYQEADATPDMSDDVFACIANANLVPPERPVPVDEPPADDGPTSTPPPPPVEGPTEPTEEPNPTVTPE